MEQTELKERRYVGVRETLIYGVANGGQVIGYNLVRMQLTFFLVTVFGIPGQAVSLMIFFMGIWDTMNDPIMGTIVDKTRWVSPPFSFSAARSFCEGWSLPPPRSSTCVSPILFGNSFTPLVIFPFGECRQPSRRTPRIAAGSLPRPA